MSTRREIARDNIMDVDEYAKIRSEKRREVNEIKKDRRIQVGPFATFYFECYETMLHQVHEMLYIERGGEAQIADELAAYNPLVPQGRELVATLMFEIDDPVRRDRELRRLTFVEQTVAFSVDGEEIRASAETDVERTKADGKTSSIHFLRFPFTEAAVEKFKKEGTKIVLAINHENYDHMAVVPDRVRAALARDFD